MTGQNKDNKYPISSALTDLLNGAAKLVFPPADKNFQRLAEAPLTSAYPEDFTGFNPDPFTPHHSAEERREDVLNFFRKHGELGVLPQATLDTWATTKGSMLVQTFMVDPEGLQINNKKVNAYFMLRRSQRMTAAQHLSVDTGLNADDLTPALSKLDIEYLDTYKMIAQIQANTDGVALFKGSRLMEYRANLQKDAYAMGHYKSEQADKAEAERVLRGYIAMRALSGFISGDARLQVAPQEAFSHEFAPNLESGVENQKSRLKDLDPYKVWAAYAELRALAAPDDSLEAHRSGTTLRELKRIVGTNDLTPFTYAIGNQILEAAALLCPKLLQEPAPGTAPSNHITLG